MKEARLHPGFEGDVTALRQTEIIPALSTPVPKHKNLVWVPSSVGSAPCAAQGQQRQIEISFPTRLASNFLPGWLFKESLGQRVSTSFFGMPVHANQEVQILYASEAYGSGPVRGEFIFDPSPQSSPYQVVLALVPLAETLAATLRDVEDKMVEFSQRVASPIFLAGGMEVTIPSVYFRIRARPYAIALELNHASDSNSKEGLASPSGSGAFPLSIWLNKPFLLLVRERGTAEPLMVVWIDNAELISRRPPWWPSVLRSFW